jgi:hypothetical protein
MTVLTDKTCQVGFSYAGVSRHSDRQGAFADLILVEGNPLENLDLVSDPEKNFKIIMKDGRIFKDALGR